MFTKEGTGYSINEAHISQSSDNSVIHVVKTLANPNVGNLLGVSDSGHRVIVLYGMGSQVACIIHLSVHLAFIVARHRSHHSPVCTLMMVQFSA